MTMYDNQQFSPRETGPDHATLTQLPHKAIITRRADVDGLPRRMADAASVSPAALARMASDLATVVEQGRQNATRLNEELGALGVQLRQQHMDASNRIVSLQAGIGQQFDALAADMANSTNHISRVSEQLAQRQQTLVFDAVQKELALQLLPIRAKARVTNFLCGISMLVSVGLLAAILLG